ncbi:MAG TPA: ABC transporter ATP-binding protein, partial [Rhodothermales bacterium]
GLRVRRVPRQERVRRVEELLARVDLPGLEDRPVVQLSGGQQQRVALARALAVEPDVILFDEPLSNLDVALREQTRRELKQLQHRLGTTSIYVTHDQQEALALSDRIGVMRSGHLLQVAAPRELFDEPATAFVAAFLGWNVVSSPRTAAAWAGAEGPDGTVLGIRPEALTVHADGVPGRVVGSQFLGTHVEWSVETEAGMLRAWLPPDLELPEQPRFRSIRHRWLRNDLTGDMVS